MEGSGHGCLFHIVPRHFPGEKERPRKDYDGVTVEIRTEHLILYENLKRYRCANPLRVVDCSISKSRNKHVESLLFNLGPPRNPCDFQRKCIEYKVQFFSSSILIQKFFLPIIIWRVSRSSVVDWDTMLQAWRSRFRFPVRSLDFSIDVNLPAALLHWGRLSL
jgi:hypothetical protein